MFDIGTAIIAAIVILATGAAIALYLWLTGFDFVITVKEYIAGSIVICLLIVPVSTLIGGNIAQANAIDNFSEFWNGSVIEANQQTIKCERDGKCQHVYDCDHYTETEWYTETKCDSDGNCTSERKSRDVPKHRHCPYATQETNYWIVDSFGERHDIGKGVFDANPTPWRSSKAIPANLPCGVPEYWQAASDGIANGRLLPITKVSKYRNYLLAADTSLLHAYSDEIDKYDELGLLVPHTQNLNKPVTDQFVADKFTFVGRTLSDDAEWQDALSRLNAKLGMMLQGDLHVVAIDANKVDSPDDYTNALLAYWQSKAFGKKGLAKNAIMLVVGVKDGKVEWARAKTGIPIGNGAMLSALSTRLPGVEFAPDVVIGSPGAKVVDGKPVYDNSDGVVDQIMTVDYPFARPCMDCTDVDDEGSGLVYLKSEVSLSGWAKFWIGFADFVIALPIWLALARWDLFEPIRKRVREFSFYR